MHICTHATCATNKVTQRGHMCNTHTHTHTHTDTHTHRHTQTRGCTVMSHHYKAMESCLETHSLFRHAAPTDTTHSHQHDRVCLNASRPVVNRGQRGISDTTRPLNLFRCVHSLHVCVVTDQPVVDIDYRLLFWNLTLNTHFRQFLCTLGSWLCGGHRRCVSDGLPWNVWILKVFLGEINITIFYSEHYRDSRRINFLQSDQTTKLNITIVCT